MANETILDDTDTVRVVEKLIAATRAGKIVWETTEFHEVYQTVFMSGVVLSRKNGRHGLEIMNSSGDTVLSYYPEGEGRQHMLEQLHHFAHVSALKPRQVLLDIAREIDEQLLRKN